MARSTYPEKIAARDKMIERLEDLVITLPQRMRDAEAQGLELFTVLVYGYQVVYYLTEDGWQAYFSDTAD